MEIDIANFLRINTSLDASAIKHKRSVLTNLLSFDEVGKKEDNLMRFIDFSKNTIRNIAIVFPNMIINKVTYDNVKIPKHWKFSDRHNTRLRDFVQSHYAKLYSFYGESTITPLLVKMIQALDTLLIIEQTIPIIRENNTKNQEPLFDERTLKGLYQYFILSIFELMTKLSKMTDVIIQEVIPFGDDIDIMSRLQVEEEATGQITELEIVAGEKKNINEKIASMMIEFINIIDQDKHSVNYNEKSIKEKINRARDVEKDDIVDELGELSIESREIEFLFKKHRLGGRWAKGKDSGIVKHNNDFYDRALDEAESREHRRTKVPTDRNSDIIEMEEDAQNIRFDEIDAEENSMGHLPEDDDFGDNDAGYTLDYDGYE
jgi:hypothetical protein